jgi:hypothetical protein
MKKIDTFHVSENITLAAIIAVLYFCSILLFSYFFTQA